MSVTIRYAESDADVVAIHGFLVVMMGPMLPFDIDPKNSATEVWRVVNSECAIMAIKDGLLVGTVGLIKAPFWWAADKYFLANRWCAILPDSGALHPLIHEAVSFAKGLATPEEPGGLELHLYDETKGRLLILNRHPRRRDENPILMRGTELRGSEALH